MARINSVSMGRAAKKLGNMVYYTMNGKTYARTRVEQVKNPKTAKQMAQRLIFTTAVRSRDALKSIVDHSFENKKYGSESLSYFMKRNLEILRARAAADNGLTGSFNVPYGITMQANPLFVSQGTLPSVKYSFSSRGLALSLGSDKEITTIADFLSANSTIRKGDQITIMLLIPNASVEEAVTDSGEVVNPTYLIKMRVVIPVNIADDEVFFDSVNGVLGSLLITEGIENFSLNLIDGNMLFLGNNDEIGSCGCIIISRPEGKKWLRSTEYMKMNPNYDDSLYNFNDVLNTWMQGTTEIVGLEDNEYLNQGQEAEVSNSYSLQSRSFNMTVAETGQMSLDDLAALDTTTSKGSRITQIIYKQTSQQAAAGKITCYKIQSGNVLEPDTVEYKKPSNAAALITFDDANRLLGGVLSIKQAWRGKTTILAGSFSEGAALEWADFYGGNPNKVDIPALPVAIEYGTTGAKARLIVENGYLVGTDGTPALITCYYGGSATSPMQFSKAAVDRLAQIAGAQIVCDGQTYTFSTEYITYNKWKSITPALTDAEWDW